MGTPQYDYSPEVSHLVLIVSLCRNKNKGNLRLVLYCGSFHFFSKYDICVMLIYVEVIDKLLTNVTYVPKLFVRTFVIAHLTLPCQ